ncbi:MAG: hybrid sensor histidine kinase/response regulator, partial [Acidimicrobiales bacterium]
APLDTWFAVRAYPSSVGLTVYFQDVGSQRREQQQRARLERVESIADLAGGVAHDFNNVLMVVAGNADMVREVLDDHQVHDDTARASLAAIEQAVERAVGLTGRLVRFSQRLLTSPTVVDLDQLIGDALPELRSLLPTTVALHHVASQPPLLVDADASELRRGLHNVVANAVEAIAGEGVLTVSVTLEHSSSDDGSEAVEAVLSVADDGPGMSPEVLDRSADPFFTTKDAAAGRGMGLAEAEGIVRQAGGRLSIDSAEPHGTVVRFHLPLAEHQGMGPAPRPEPAAALVAEEEPAIEVSPLEAPDADGVRVLVVDDNEEVRRLVARVLVGHGFEVRTAANADEALAMATAEQIDLLVTDVLMPGRSGPELVRALRALLEPMPPVVYISGYADSQDLDDDLANGEASLLSKPFESAALVEAVWRLWEASTAREKAQGDGAGSR